MSILWIAGRTITTAKTPPIRGMQWEQGSLVWRKGGGGPATKTEKMLWRMLLRERRKNAGKP